MKRASIMLAAALVCLTSYRASACDKGMSLSFDGPVRLVERLDDDDVRFAIHTDDRKVILVMTDRVVGMQLSDRLLRKVDRKIRAADDDGDESRLGYLIKTAVLSSVSSMLRHSAVCDIRDIESVDYRKGELIITAKDGDRLFTNAEIDDNDVMRNFSEAEAKEFVRELRRRLN